MIHRTYAPSTAQLYTELGFGTTDATFTDFWQSAHTLLHTQQYLQSCHRSACAALVAAALTSACSTLCQGCLLYKLCLGATVSVHLPLRLNLAQLKHFHGSGSNPHPSTVHCRSLETFLDKSAKIKEDPSTQAYSKQSNNREKELIAGTASCCYLGSKTQRESACFFCFLAWFG